jgi:chromosome partitioning protein|tara:strand:- start:94 stop:888 length:795 start_codon:yes stop_codon:yes gene_type:complete
MGKIISIVNQKGGVGKTTTAVNLSASLGVLEKKILLIDADPQANATSALGVELSTIEEKQTIYEVIENNIDASETIIKTNSPNLSIIPSTINLVGAEIELVNHPNREKMLKNQLTSIKEEYDFILIDCPPSLGLITLNCLCASDSVLIPIQCEYFALEGLGKLMNTIRKIQNFHNERLSIEGLLLTMYDSRLRLSNNVIEEVKMHFGDIVFNTIIQRNVRLSEATGFGKSIIKYDANCRGAINYLNLAKEFIQKNELITNERIK